MLPQMLCMARLHSINGHLQPGTACMRILALIWCGDLARRGICLPLAHAPSFGALIFPLCTLFLVKHHLVRAWQVCKVLEYLGAQTEFLPHKWSHQNLALLPHDNRKEESRGQRKRVIYFLARDRSLNKKLSSPATHWADMNYARGWAAKVRRKSQSLGMG